MRLESTRAGVIMNTTRGYSAFVPSKLPPNPPIIIDSEMQKLLSLADRKLGRLDGITQILPNPELFVAMYVKKEAVLSAQIEGTQASLVDVLNAPSNESDDHSYNEVIEVINYVNAINWGLQHLSELPLSLRLIRNIHKVLLDGVRGSDKSPGEFRKTQNWIGPQGCTLEMATFVPPTVEEMEKAMYDLENYMYEDDDIPALIKIALIHAQFESIHPFLDGNGRIGRLLITFWLCQQEILTQPLLYLSYYFKQNRLEYYDRLMAVRTKGDWENWIKFFLRGVATVSDEATESAKKIISLQNKYSEILLQNDKSNSNCTMLLNMLFERPIITKKEVAEMLSVSLPTANAIVDMFCSLGILYDKTPDKKRYKSFVFGEYLAILQKGTEIKNYQ
ncbi:MAG: Fic family protein [Ruminococcaceae bacterium]|nr:Fic family protein [Oscillospiraceae bacterium]